MVLQERSKLIACLSGASMPRERECRASDGARLFAGTISVAGQSQNVSGRGKGLVSSVLATVQETFGVELEGVSVTV